MHKTRYNIIKYVIYLSLVFLFLPSLYIFGRTIPLYDIIIGFTLCILFLITKKNYQIIKYFSKYNFFKVLLLYVLWVFASGIYLIMMNKFSLTHFLYGVLLLFAYNNLTWYILPALISPRFISIRNIIQFLLVAIYIICIYGIIIFVLNSLNIHILDPLNNIIVNRRSIALGGSIITTRVYSVFEEAGYFGGFLCINLPIIFKMVQSKYRIFKNKYLNLIIKKTFILLVVITIILIQSPIWFVFFIISTLVYFRKMFKINTLKNFIVMCFAIFMMTIGPLFFVNKVAISTTFLNRIVQTVNSIINFDSLVTSEPSLATRLIGYSIRFKTFLHNPVTGVGYKNTEYVARDILQYMNIPLTTEMKANLAKDESILHMSGSLFWNILSDTGIIGIILFLMFVFLNIRMINKITKCLSSGLEKDFMISVKNTFIAILCFSVYDIRPNFVYFWFLFGLTPCFILYYRSLIANKILIVKKGQTSYEY